MRHQKEIRPRLKPVDLALALALVGVVTTAALIAYQRLGPLSSRAHVATMSRASADGPPLFYAVIGRTPDEFTGRESTAATTTQFTIELGHAKTEGEATQAIMKLKTQGIDAFFTPLHRSGHVIYRIRNGIFQNAEAAMKERDRLAKQGLDPAVSRL